MRNKLLLLLIIFLKLATVIYGLIKFNSLPPYSIIIIVNVFLNYAFAKTAKANALQRFVLVMSEIALPVFSSIAFSCFYISYLIKNYFIKSDESASLTPMQEDGFGKYIAYTSEKVIARSQLSHEPKLRESLSIQPFVDILHSENASQKVNVCLNITKVNQESARIKLLKIALNDNEYEVRYISNSMLNKIEKELVTEIDLLSKNILTSPQTIKNYRLRGYAKNRYALSTILHSQLKDYFLKSALDDFRYCLQAEPDNYFLIVKIAQVYAQLNMIPELLDLTEKALRLELDSDNRNKILFYRAEGFFILRDFEQMSTVLVSISRKEIKYSKISDVLDYWSTRNE
jgi:hypothetical protein